MIWRGPMKAVFNLKGWHLLTLFVAMACSQKEITLVEKAPPANPAAPQADLQILPTKLGNPAFLFNEQTLPKLSGDVQRYIKNVKVRQELSKMAYFDSLSDKLYIIGSELTASDINFFIGNLKVKTIQVDAITINLDSIVYTKGADIILNALELNPSNDKVGSINTEPRINPALDLAPEGLVGKPGLKGGDIYLNVQKIPSEHLNFKISSAFVRQQKQIANYLMWNEALLQLVEKIEKLNKLLPNNDEFKELNRFLYTGKNLVGKPSQNVPIFNFATEYYLFKKQISQLLDQYSNLESLIQEIKINTATADKIESSIQKTLNQLGQNNERYSQLKGEVAKLTTRVAHYQTYYTDFTNQIKALETQLLSQAQENVESHNRSQKKLAELQTISQLLMVSPVGQPMSQVIGLVAQTGLKASKVKSLQQATQFASETNQKFQKFKNLDIAKETISNLRLFVEKIEKVNYELSGKGGSIETKALGSLVNSFTETRAQWNQFLEAQSQFQVSSQDIQAELNRLKSENPDYIKLVFNLETLLQDRQTIIDELTLRQSQSQQVLSEWTLQSEILQTLEKERINSKSKSISFLAPRLQQWKKEYVQLLAESLLNLKASYDYLNLSDNQFLLEPLNVISLEMSSQVLRTSLNDVTIQIEKRLIQNIRDLDTKYIFKSDRHQLTIPPATISMLNQTKAVEFIVGQEALMGHQLNARLSQVKVHSQFSANNSNKVDQKAQLRLIYIGEGYLKTGADHWVRYQFPQGHKVFQWGQSVQMDQQGALNQSTIRSNLLDYAESIGVALQTTSDQQKGIRFFSNPPLVGRYLLILDNDKSEIELESLKIDFDFEYTSL